MSKKTKSTQSLAWVQGEIRLAGALDKRMIHLLRAVEQSGSINKAAKQMDLSYKGAWQMIERANNFSPKVLISTATGGAHGGGTSLTAAGKALLQLFDRLEQQHNAYLEEINRNLEADSVMLMLLKPLAVKTSATNQIFGTVITIHSGEIISEVLVELKGGANILASLTASELDGLELQVGSKVLLLINSPDISIAIDTNGKQLSARNNLPGAIIRLQSDEIEAEVVIRLTGDDSLTAVLTGESAEELGLQIDQQVNAVFKSNAVLLAVLQA
jgi:molybdate transport system regulatory protein